MLGERDPFETHIPQVQSGIKSTEEEEEEEEREKEKMKRETDKLAN